MTLVTFRIIDLWGSLLSGGGRSFLSGDKKRYVKLMQLGSFSENSAPIYLLTVMNRYSFFKMSFL